MQCDFKYKCAVSKCVNEGPPYYALTELRMAGHPDDFKETIFVYLDPWTKEDYEKQWREGLERLKTHDTSCLITCVSDPKSSAVVGWWTLHRVGNTVFIQNGYLSKVNYKKIVGKSAFTLETCYNFVTPRVTDRQVSEWSVPYNED